jgi:hypothetical protein
MYGKTEVVGKINIGGNVAKLRPNEGSECSCSAKDGGSDARDRVSSALIDVELLRSVLSSDICLQVFC